MHITLYLPCIGTHYLAPNTPIIAEKFLEDTRERLDGEFKRVLETQGDHFRLVQHIIQTQAMEQYPAKPRFRSQSRGVNEYKPVKTQARGIRKLRSNGRVSLPLATYDPVGRGYAGLRSKSRGPGTARRRPIMVELAPDQVTDPGILDIRVLPGLFQSEAHSLASYHSESGTPDL